MRYRSLIDEINDPPRKRTKGASILPLHPSTGDGGHTHPMVLNYLYLNGTFIYILACILSTLITKLVAGGREALVEIEILPRHVN